MVDGPVGGVFGPVGCPSGDELFKAICAGLPDAPLLRKPAVEQTQPAPVEFAGADPTCLPGSDESACLQGSDVLHERGKRNGQRVRQLADTRRSPSQTVDDRSARGIRKSREHRIELIRILSHEAKYYIETANMTIGDEKSLRGLLSNVVH